MVDNYDPKDPKNGGTTIITPAAKAAEAELERRVTTLKQQLVEATQALERLKQTKRTTTATPTKSSPSFLPGMNRIEKALSLDEDDSTVSNSEQHQQQGTLAPKPPALQTTTTPALPPPGKRGYLFKWQDRSMGWTGTKWALRFVSLENGRISYYYSHSETFPRYVLNLRGCAVRDDGWKRNQRHASFRNKKAQPPPLDEVGAYFFLFSIYQRQEDSPTATTTTTSIDEDDSEIVPLLRFSTNSLAEKTQWIHLIAETCAYCETEAFQADEASRAAEMDRQQEQLFNMAVAMPEAQQEGTLPPLVFAPPRQKQRRKPSFTRSPSSKFFRTKSQNIDANQVDARSTKGYPPSKPMHRAAAPSYLSSDAPVQNYRGFFNLGIIILVVSNFRLILATIQREGFVLTRAAKHLKDLPHIRQDPWEDFPFVSGLLLLLFFLLSAFCIEWLLSRKRLDEMSGMLLHHINAHTTMATSLWIAWHYINKPWVAAVLLFHGTITWMKILSYALANEDYRLTTQNKHHNEVDSHRATLALIDNLDPEEMDMVYPRNVTIGNILYFFLAPTLTYQMAFPKYPRVRLWKVADLLFRMAFVLGLFTFVLAQVVNPALEGIVRDLEQNHGRYSVGMLAEYWLRLTIANTYLWLLMFYFYFHLYLNLFAEILRFGDRVFYKDWWNSSEVSAYWRLWNLPTHYWLIRHFYFPTIRFKFSKGMATFLVFFFSAVMHEVLVSVPFHMVRPWSFLGMIMQLPLVWLTKHLHQKYPGSSVGNIIFWFSFCVVGQPVAVLLYTIDFQYAKLKQESMQSFEEQCRVMMFEKCIVR